MERQLPGKHEHTACPRCHRVFECRVGSINLCHCQAVQLTDDQRYYASSSYQGCLCADCLLAVQTEYNHLTHQKTLTDLLSGH